VRQYARGHLQRVRGEARKGDVLMTDNEQVKALRARAEGMGFIVVSAGLLMKIHIDEWTGITLCTDEPDSVPITATLLNALDPDAVVVVIAQYPDGGCHETCAFFYDLNHNCRGCCLFEDADGGKAHVNCPGPCDDDHEYVLVKRRKVTK
jgi:hypothetical protein